MPISNDGMPFNDDTLDNVHMPDNVGMPGNVGMPDNVNTIITISS